MHPTFGSALNFVPPLFCLYLAFLLVVAPFVIRKVPWGCLLAVLLGCYVLAVLAQGAVLARRGKQALTTIGAVPLIVLTHILYGWGFWRRPVDHVKPPGQRPTVEVALEQIPLRPSALEVADADERSPDEGG